MTYAEFNNQDLRPYAATAASCTSPSLPILTTKRLSDIKGDIIRNRYIASEGAVLPLGYDFYTQTQYANKELLLNAVNYLVGDDGLMASRSRNIKLRKLDVMKVKEERTKYQIINVALPVALLALAGAVIVIARRKKYRK